MLDIVQTRLEVGVARQQDVYLAEADVGSAKERQRQAQGAFEQAVRSLEVILGRYPRGRVKRSLRIYSGTTRRASRYTRGAAGATTRCFLGRAASGRGIPTRRNG